MTTLPPELVIFDCDGVLVDSEALANANLAAVLTASGFPITAEAVRARWVGRSLRTVEDDILAETGRPLAAGWLDRLRARDTMLFREKLTAVPFVRAAVEQVHAAGIATCIASSGSFDKMDVTLSVTGLKPLFEGRIFSSRQVARGKPYPDLFLFAAERMGAFPQQAAVIEDSPAGVTAARAAGMAAFGYAGDPLTDRAGLAEAGAVLFDDMRRLPALLGLG